jgi:hypothetical protein
MTSGVRKVCPCMYRRNIEVLRCQPLTPWLSREMAMNPATCEPPELSLSLFNKNLPQVIQCECKTSPTVHKYHSVILGLQQCSATGFYLHYHNRNSLFFAKSYSSSSFIIQQPDDQPEVLQQFNIFFLQDDK